MFLGKVGNRTYPIQIGELLEEIQTSMYRRAVAYRDANTFQPTDYNELQEVVQKGWALSWWCGSSECEAKVKEDTKATTRCIPLEHANGEGKCIVCQKRASQKVYFARAY